MPASVQRVVEALASLKLTVALFALSMLLIFAGTLAQVHDGIWQVMADYFRTPIAWIDLQLFVPRQLATVRGSVPFPGGFTLGGLLIVNLLAAHAVRFKLSWKRAGIIVLHLGVIVLLLGEFVAALWAEEGLMTIDEGSYANYVEDIREAELVVMDRSDPEQDRVVAVPEWKLTRRGEVIGHEALPFEITVDEWMGNSRVFNLPPDMKPHATRGLGAALFAQAQPPVSGVENQSADAPSAYITLHKDGETLGTWLVSIYLNPEQQVTVDGRTYHLGLRFKRTYKPYTLHLMEFTHERFVGTQTPRNFSSRVRLVDPAQNEDREVLIYMNNPLRYQGATFYQSAYKEGDVGTILQVVRNPGWMMPYIACALVALGMLMHFGLHLVQFARKAGR